MALDENLLLGITNVITFIPVGGTSVLNLKGIHPKVVETFHTKIKKCQCATGVGQKAKIIRIIPVGNINACTNFHGIHPIVIYIVWIVWTNVLDRLADQRCHLYIHA